MSVADTSGDKWVIECSDEDISREGYEDGECWMPQSAELQHMYDNIGSLYLDWKCPGRRLPSPLHQTEDGPQVQQATIKSPSELSSFDFKDEMSSLKLRVRREGEDTLRGSAKKKTTSFDGVVSNIMRHKMLQQMERNQEMDGNH